MAEPAHRQRAQLSTNLTATDHSPLIEIPITLAGIIDRTISQCLYCKKLRPQNPNVGNHCQRVWCATAALHCRRPLTTAVNHKDTLSLKLSDGIPSCTCPTNLSRRSLNSMPESSSTFRGEVSSSSRLPPVNPACAALRGAYAKSLTRTSFESSAETTGQAFQSAGRGVDLAGRASLGRLLLLNPDHPGFVRVTLVSSKLFFFDPRIFK